jgi:hypothetical protein
MSEATRSARRSGMDERKTPDIRPGEADIDADMRAQDEEQWDAHEHLLAVDAANRRLRKALRAHAGDRRRPWQRQVALVTRSGFGPGGRWGVLATVFVWLPQGGGDGVEDVRERFGVTWREAIADVVHAVLHDEP